MVEKRILGNLEGERQVSFYFQMVECNDIVLVENVYVSMENVLFFMEF